MCQSCPGLYIEYPYIVNVQEVFVTSTNVVKLILTCSKLEVGITRDPFTLSIEDISSVADYGRSDGSKSTSNRSRNKTKMPLI